MRYTSALHNYETHSRVVLLCPRIRTFHRQKGQLFCKMLFLAVRIKPAPNQPIPVFMWMVVKERDILSA